VGSEARTRLGLAGLLLVTWVSFNQLFAPGDFPGPILLGMLIATGLAIAARRLGVGSLSTLGISAAALLWYVAFVFETGQTFLGLPTPSAVAGITRSIVRAYSFSQVDFAPVPVRVGYVILVVGGMWSAAAIAELATFRWKRPLLATLPSIALFATTMIFGTGAGAPVLMVLFLAALLTFWGLEASHRMRSWGRWVAGQPNRSHADSQSVTGSVARRMGAGCIAVALVAPMFLPALGDGLFSWRTQLGEGLGTGSGIGGGGRIDPLVSIAPSLVNQSNQVLFSVKSNRSSYWRLVALPVFDGETWRPAAGDERELDDGLLQGDWIPSVAERARIEQEVTVVGLRGGYLPAAVQPRAVQVTEGNDDVTFHPQTGDLRTEAAGEELSYRVTSIAPRPTFEDLIQSEPGDTDPVFSEMPVLSPAVEKLRNRWTVGETTPYGKLVAIQDALQSDDFSYRLPRPEDLAADQQSSTNELERFLLETKSGYCQQFATAFAALSRSLGYPTRVVVGFLPGESRREGEYTVRGIDAHSWPEVFFEGYGWIRFEPTPRADNGRVTTAPAYTSPEFVSRGPLGSDGGAGGGAPGNAETPEGTLDARALNDPSRDGAGSAIGLQERAGQGADTAGADFDDTNAVWQQTFRRLALALIVLTMAALVAIPALKARRIRRAYRGATTPRAIAAAAFLEFMIEAGELAAPRGAAESARAYARRIADLKGLPPSSALRLASIYERAEYAPSEPSVADSGEARSLVRDMRSLLWHKASWWERGARLFSPRNLWPV